MGILFTTHMGFLFTITMGILFTIVQGIQFTISILLSSIIKLSFLTLYLFFSQIFVSKTPILPFFWLLRKNWGVARTRPLDFHNPNI